MPFDTRAAPSRRAGPFRRLLALLSVALLGALASAIAIVPAAGAADASASARHTGTPLPAVPDLAAASAFAQMTVGPIT